MMKEIPYPLLVVGVDLTSLWWATFSGGVPSSLPPRPPCSSLLGYYHGYCPSCLP